MQSDYEAILHRSASLSLGSDHHQGRCPSVATIFLDGLHSFELTINSGQLLRPMKSSVHSHQLQSHGINAVSMLIPHSKLQLFFSTNINWNLSGKIDFRVRSLCPSTSLWTWCIRSWEDKAQSMAIFEADESSAKALKQQSLLQPRVNYTSLTGWGWRGNDCILGGEI